MLEAVSLAAKTTRTLDLLCSAAAQTSNSNKMELQSWETASPSTPLRA
jgi:hypothetical protein